MQMTRRKNCDRIRRQITDLKFEKKSPSNKKKLRLKSKLEPHQHLKIYTNKNLVFHISKKFKVLFLDPWLNMFFIHVFTVIKIYLLIKYGLSP